MVLKPEPAAALKAALATPAEPVPSTPAGRRLAVGTAVTVNYRKSGNYFPGKVSCVNADGTYEIEYDDGDSEGKVKPENVHVLESSAAAPEAQLSQSALSPSSESEPATHVQIANASLPVISGPQITVGSRVEAHYRSGKGKWYKGVVTGAIGGTFTVTYDDGEEEDVQPEYIKLLEPAASEPTLLEAITPVIAIIGVKGAGKSTLLKAMAGEEDPKPRPTTGFNQSKLPFQILNGPEATVHWYDLPGSWTSKWEGYLLEAHAVVYVIAADDGDEAFGAAAATFEETRRKCARVMQGKPLLVLANKQDAPGARSAEQVGAALGLGHGLGLGGEAAVVGCSGHPAKNGGAFDTRAEQGLEWLLGGVAARFRDLKARVAADTAAAEAERVAEKLERNRRVMVKCLGEKAFPKEGPPQETFSEVDGFEFMAMELLIHDPQVPEKNMSAENNWGLHPEAMKCARLVGFQKVAMMMCAEMINPGGSAKKVSYSWEHVLAYVADCREAAGLSRE